MAGTEILQLLVSQQVSTLTRDLTSSQELLWLEVLTGVVVVSELLLLLSKDLRGKYFLIS